MCLSPIMQGSEDCTLRPWNLFSPVRQRKGIAHIRWKLRWADLYEKYGFVRMKDEMELECL